MNVLGALMILSCAFALFGVLVGPSLMPGKGNKSRAAESSGFVEGLLLEGSTSQAVVAASPLPLLMATPTISPSVASCHEGPATAKIGTENEGGTSPTPSPSFWNASSSSSSSSSTTFTVPSSYALDLSTEDNHRSTLSEDPKAAARGRFALMRSKLDYSYHAIYTESRQLVQDDIIMCFLNRTIVVDSTGNTCDRPADPWIVFTAGAMGAGKTHTIRFLASNGRFPLQSFVVVDPDDIRRQLPEFDWYVKHDPNYAGERTRKEAGYIAELLTMAALEQGKNVLVDGSLKDSKWYRGYFEKLRKTHSNLRIAILHITAPTEEVFQRAETRSGLTGRIVPRKTIEEALEMVPKSVKVLAPLSDFYCEIHNAETIQLATRGVDWESFERTWTQNCELSKQRSVTKNTETEESPSSSGFPFFRSML